ncbi:MAG TPA: class II D-tagatose-bisphosphate aldolase, non-catalytic subunit, partial [Mycobacterium sp.]|nr:class II D-tagatose-bisphosphate aldolase, non-catalytic subunit [Mycobacterium sp.]
MRRSIETLLDGTGIDADLRALPSFCTANEDVLRAMFEEIRDEDAPLLIEATSNQVNQFGGYTGFTPS